jgi:hypothetical protein
MPGNFKECSWCIMQASKVRIAKWCGWTLLLLSAPSTFLGLMTYSFAGFPFGGATQVEEGRARGLQIVCVSSVLMAIGIGLVIVGWRRNPNRDRQKAEQDPSTARQHD